MRAYHCKSDRFRYVAAGRSELGRDDATHEQLEGEKDRGKETLTRLKRLFRVNTDNFRKLAIEAAEQQYDSNQIKISAGSVRAYVQRRRRKYGHFDFGSVEHALRAQEERFRVALCKFQGVPLMCERVQNIISGAIGWIAVQDVNPTVEASNVASALEAMHNELDQLEQRPVNQIGTAPQNFHVKQFLRYLNIVNSGFLILFGAT